MTTKEKALEQAKGILGEHYKNYVVIAQDEDIPTFFDCHYSDPFATYGLILEASKYHSAQMNAIGQLEEVEWVWEDEEEDE